MVHRLYLTEGQVQVVCAYIDDGYTITTKIEATEFHPSVSITYRPARAAERRKTYLAVAQAERNAKGEVTAEGIDRGERLVAEAISRHVSEWTVRDRGDHIPAITPDEVLKLEPHLAGSIWRLVMGEDAPTEDAEKN